MRKLGSLTAAAVLCVEHAERGFLNCGDDARRNSSAAPGKRLRLSDCAFHHLRLLNDVAVLFFVGVGNAHEHALEAGAAVTVGRREIRAAIKRFAIGGKKSGERPAALSADRADRGLVAAVDVGTLV